MENDSIFEGETGPVLTLEFGTGMPYEPEVYEYSVVGRCLTDFGRMANMATNHSVRYTTHVNDEDGYGFYITFTGPFDNVMGFMRKISESDIRIRGQVSSEYDYWPTMTIVQNAMLRLARDVWGFNLLHTI